MPRFRHTYRYRTLLLFLAVGLYILLTGCGTLVSKAEFSSTRPTQVGHPYSGVQVDASGMKCALELPWTAKEKSYWLTVPGALFIFAFFLVDTALSLAADTVLLPIDLFTEPRNERATLEHPC